MNKGASPLPDPSALQAMLGDAKVSDELKIALLNQSVEQDRFEKQQSLETRKWRYSTPLAVALAGAITIGLNYVFDSMRADQQSEVTAQSEAKAFQYSILKSELEKETSAQEKADALLFLAQAGLLDDLNVEYLIEVAQDAPEKIPQLGRIDRTAEDNALSSIFDDDDIYDQVIRWEGGFVENSIDPRGSSNMGITMERLSEHRGVSVTIDDLRDMTRAEAREIYSDILAPTRATEVENIFLRAAYAQAAINTGSARAVRFLQKLVGVEETGKITTETLELVNARARENERETVVSFNCFLKEYYDSLAQRLPLMEMFLDGWLNRLSDFTPGGSLSVCDA